MIQGIRQFVACGFIVFLSGCCYAAGDEAIELLEIAIDRSSKCARLFHDYDLQEALECYEALKAEAEHPIVRAAALQGAAYVYQKRGMRREAIERMQEALHASHSYDEAVLFNARLLAGYSDLLLGYEQYPLAERYLQMALDLYTTYSQVVDSHIQTGMVVHHVFATLYFETSRLDLARISINKAIAYADGDPDINPLTSLLLLANIEYAESNLEEALSVSAIICESDSRSKVVVEGCILRARALISRGRASEALEGLFRARALLERAPWEGEDLRDQLGVLEASLKTGQ